MASFTRSDGSEANRHSGSVLGGEVGTIVLTMLVVGLWNGRLCRLNDRRAVQLLGGC